jgi:dTDP-4-amino-4,6-dideoxygalactose transaminase
MSNKKLIEFENLSNLNKEFTKVFLNKVSDPKVLKTYILGENVITFEKNFAKFLNTKKKVIGVANGTDALTLSIKDLKEKNINRNEVIVAANSYYASILSIINAGCKPILVEPDLSSYNIDENKIENKITKKTLGIMTVHMYGKPCNLINIQKICKKHKIGLIEDCAQAHGAKINNKYTGTFGEYGCFSFYPTKNLGCIGDGGAIMVNKKTENSIKKIRNYGSIIRYKNDILGVNSRLDEIQSIFLNIKLKSLNKIIKKKRSLARIYFERLKSDYILPIIEKNKYDVFYIFNVRHPNRDKLRKYLFNNNIMTDIHYPVPPYKQKALKGFFNKEYKISDEIHNTTISLPISFINSENDIERICNIMNKF